MPNITCNIIANYLIIRVFIGGVGIINNETSQFIEKLQPLWYIAKRLFIAPKITLIMCKNNKNLTQNIAN